VRKSCVFGDHKECAIELLRPSWGGDEIPDNAKRAVEKHLSHLTDGEQQLGLDQRFQGDNA
jgi:hypothetical protein